MLMRTHTNTQINRTMELLSTLPKAEQKAVMAIVESLASKAKTLNEFLESAPEEKPTKEELELIKKAKRSNKTISYDRFMEKYDV